MFDRFRMEHSRDPSPTEDSDAELTGFGFYVYTKYLSLLRGPGQVQVLEYFCWW
jgi:hypothetical protein